MPRRKTPLESEPVEPKACTVDVRLHVLHQVPFFADLSHTEIAEVNHSFVAVAYQTDETIYFAGDVAERLYVVATGKVRVLRHTLAGQDVWLDILAPGEFFGSLTDLGDDVYVDTAQAQTGCCVLSITREEFQSILRRYPPVVLRVLTLTAARLKDAYETIRQLSAHSAEQRIAAVLLKLAEKLGEESGEGLLIQIPLARQDIAALAGTTVETASRILSQFRKDGLIRSGRQWIAIADQEGLALLAEGETVS
jgi:CRP/FNR family transcriptional regulator, nitrogen oxide reductase regulator